MTQREYICMSNSEARVTNKEPLTQKIITNKEKGRRSLNVIYNC